MWVVFSQRFVRMMFDSVERLNTLSKIEINLFYWIILESLKSQILDIESKESTICNYLPSFIATKVVKISKTTEARKGMIYSKSMKQLHKHQFLNKNIFQRKR